MRLLCQLVNTPTMRGEAGTLRWLLGLTALGGTTIARVR